jgi:retron-type reverse transcriptase
VAHHTDLAWVKLYVGRWLRAPVEHPDGTRVERTKGTPQGGVVTPPTMVQNFLSIWR